MIIFAVASVTAVGFARTLGFTVWNVKNKNYTGALALTVLNILMLCAVFLTFLS